MIQYLSIGALVWNANLRILIIRLALSIHLAGHHQVSGFLVHVTPHMGQHIYIIVWTSTPTTSGYVKLYHSCKQGWQEGSIAGENMWFHTQHPLSRIHQILTVEPA